jgi:hypothetical protein
MPGYPQSRTHAQLHRDALARQVPPPRPGSVPAIPPASLRVHAVDLIPPLRVCTRCWSPDSPMRWPPRSTPSGPFWPTAARAASWYGPAWCTGTVEIPTSNPWSIGHGRPGAPGTGEAAAPPRATCTWKTWPNCSAWPPIRGSLGRRTAIKPPASRGRTPGRRGVRGAGTCGRPARRTCPAPGG